MYSFKNDYCEGAHPNILKALMESNMNQEEGYGLDKYNKEAIERIKKHIGDDACDIHLIAGGTLTNLIAISAFLRPHEACIAAKTGHIAVHETGAIEATGHKIITVDSEDGKIRPNQIEKVIKKHHFEHMVKPKLVYISNPTEVGTVYTKEEMKKIYDYCKSENINVYCDGARLGVALTAKGYDLTMKDIYDNSDAFFIGGTKIGALLGEALVVKNMDLKDEMRYIIKQRGALLAKGRILGLQFNELFKDDLYFKLAKHGNNMAAIISSELKKLGCNFLIDSKTNQIFPIMKNEIIEKMEEKFLFYRWVEIDQEHSAIRLITSWATKEEAVQEFIELYENICPKFASLS